MLVYAHKIARLLAFIPRANVLLRASVYVTVAKSRRPVKSHVRWSCGNQRAKHQNQTRFLFCSFSFLRCLFFFFLSLDGSIKNPIEKKEKESDRGLGSWTAWVVLTTNCDVTYPLNCLLVIQLICNILLSSFVFYVASVLILWCALKLKT